MSDSPRDDADEVGETESRRPGGRRLRRSPSVMIVTLTVAILVLLAMDGWIVAKRARYHDEIARLRTSMTDVERQRTDQIVEQEQNKLRIAVELMRRQARLEPALHLAIAIDSGMMSLEREGALLRRMPVQIGPERRVGSPPDTVRLAAPRGLRTIVRVVADSEPWTVPAWVYAERGVAAPPERDRSVIGGLGPVAVVLDGGTLIYSMPSAGPLNDSGYVLPGAVRARAEDLRAILPNLAAGVRVYFY